MTAENFTVETLAGGTKVCVDKAHRFGTDAFLLSDFCRVKYRQSVLDIGTGCGIIPLRFKDRGHRGLCVGIDISPDSNRLFRRSIEINGFNGIFRVEADARGWKSDILFDRVTCNPPYFTGGFKSRGDKAAIRHQITLDDRQAALTARRCLKDGGRYCVCQRPENLAAVVWAMKSRGIEPKILRFVRRKKNSGAPWLMLMDGRKNGGQGLSVLPDLVMRDENGRPTAELLKIYDKDTEDICPAEFT